MSEIKILIADDEYFAREVIQNYLKDKASLQSIIESTNGRETIEKIQEHKPDIVFLDIQMPEISGIDLINELDPAQRPIIIFTTASEQYALKAFEVNAIDYLLKPFDKERFDGALAKAVERIENRGGDLQLMFKKWQDSNQHNQQLNKPQHLTRILVKEPKKMFFVKIEDVYSFEASGDYVIVHLEKKSHLISQSLNQLEAHLNSNDFVRIHRSNIVNVNYIAEFEPYFNSEYFITLKNNSRLKLSRTYRDRLGFLFADIFDH